MGVLPSQRLRALIAGGAIAASRPVEPDQVQPASLDLRLGAFAVRVRASFLAGAGRSVESRLPDFEMHRFPLDGGAVLEKGCVYLVPLMERLRLPEGAEAAANAKSSTGRLDLLTRLICDEGTEFDRVPAGYDGPLWAEICPRSFSVLVRPGMRLNQLRLRSGPSTLADAALRALHAARPLVAGAEAVIDDGLAFSVDLRDGRADGLAGWRAKPHAGVIDLARIAHYAPRDFWETVEAGNGRLILDPGAFYILMSREAVAIPPDHAAEMAPYLAMVGEFRVHYAGFFDPGFGWDAPSRAVLEVRCHEAPFALEHGQTVGRLLFERMEEAPDRLYGAGIASHYQGQGLKLSKHFRG
jgi:dCTP deaminase